MENIAKAILKVTDWITGLEKDEVVWTWKNAYKGISEKMVKWAVKKLMIENWLSILPIWVTPTTQVERWEEEAEHYNSKDKYMKSKQSIFTEVTTKYLLLHSSWESIELVGYGHWVDAQDKGAGKATTYALKNTLMNTFMMITWEDSDDTHSQDIEVPKKKQDPWVEYVFQQSDIDQWNGKIYPWNSVYVNWDKKKISEKQVAKLKAHEKYTELPPKE